MAAIGGGPRAAAAADSTGQWSDLADWPIVPIHAALTPDGMVMTYGTTQTGEQAGHLDYDIWNPLLGTGPESHSTRINGTSTDLFCSTQVIDLAGITHWFANPLQPEFAAQYEDIPENDHEAYLRRVYFNMLGRQPDEDGFQYWKSLMDNGALDRAQVVRWVSVNAEFENRFPYGPESVVPTGIERARKP